MPGGRRWREESLQKEIYNTEKTFGAQLRKANIAKSLDFRDPMRVGAPLALWLPL